MELSLGNRVVAGVTVVAVRGEVDVYSSPNLRGHLDDLIDAGQHTLVVDLSAVTFLDSTGLGTLVAAHKRTAELGGTLPLVANQDRILKLFRITGLDGVFGVYPSLEAALESVSAAG